MSVVKTPFLLPNCRGSDLMDVNCRSRFITNRSSSHAIRHVSDIGRMSFSMIEGGDFFGRGVSIARFHFSGTSPSLMELLKVAVIGGGAELAPGCGASMPGYRRVQQPFLPLSSSNDVRHQR